MIKGGIATIFVSNMDRAVKFYTDVLGLQLVARYGNHWAEVDAGNGYRLGLHPASPSAPPPGTAGSVQIGLEVDEPINDVVERLKRRGVAFAKPIVDDGAVLLAFFKDPDGTVLYLCEVKTAAQGAGP